MSGVDLAALPRPQFIDADPAALTRRLMESYEAMTGKALLPAQPERLFLDWLAYHLTLQRLAVQEAAEQTLLAYARYPMLDHIGTLIGVTRLEARAAAARFEVRLAAPMPHERSLGPLRVRSSDNRWSFTGGPVLVPAGAVIVETTLTATETGAAANGYLPGQISTLEEQIPGVAAVVNIGASYGGAALEDDERLRSRIQEAPERFSVAGPAGAYRALAYAAHAAITDVAVLSPAAGTVRVVLLTNEGAPSPDLLALASAVLSAEKARPLSDAVETAAPARVAFTLSAVITLRAGVDRASVQAAVRAAAAAYVAERRAGLGRDLIPSQAVAALQGVPGVHRVDLLSPPLTVLAGDQWADGSVGDIVFVAEGADG